MIRGLVKEYLESQGYSVHGAFDGAQGLQYFRENVDRIDLVILDMVMPKIGGEELYHALKNLRPGIKVIISSGYSTEDKRLSRMIERGAPFIHKPYSLSDLSAMVEKILGAPGLG